MKEYNQVNLTLTVLELTDEGLVKVMEKLVGVSNVIHSTELTTLFDQYKKSPQYLKDISGNNQFKSEVTRMTKFLKTVSGNYIKFESKK